MDQSTYSRRLFFLLFLGIVVYLVREFLVPVAMGAVFATVLDPAMHWFHRSKVSINQRAMIITPPLNSTAQPNRICSELKVAT